MRVYQRAEHASVLVQIGGKAGRTNGVPEAGQIRRQQGPATQFGALPGGAPILLAAAQAMNKQDEVIAAENAPINEIPLRVPGPETQKSD